MEKPIQPENIMAQEGRKVIIDRYNINDQAHAKSSPDDFVNTVSAFHNADEDRRSDQDEPTP